MTTKEETPKSTDRDMPEDDAMNLSSDENNGKAGDGEEQREEPMEDGEREGGDPLAAVKEDLEKTTDRLLRLSAEFENYKKRITRETAEFRKYANESLIKELLPVVDNLERAVATAGDGQDNNSSILEGVEMTINEILKIFSKFGVARIDALGEAFDPSFHQAVMREESTDHAENTVTKELQKGYLMHDRLIRPAMVAVSVPAAAANEKEKSRETASE